MGEGGEIALIDRNAFLKRIKKILELKHSFKHITTGQINVQEIKMRSEDWVKPVAGL